MPDILPVCMQDILHGRKPELRTQLSSVNELNNYDCGGAGPPLQDAHMHGGKMIHLFKNNGYNIVLDVNSGSVHVVDDVVYDTLAQMDENDEHRYGEENFRRIAGSIVDQYAEQGIGEDDMREIFADLQELEDNGTLFTKDVYQDGVIDFKKRQTVVKALCLHIAHDCNLACRYCFAGEGEYKGDRSLMSFEVGKKALDFLVENSGNRRNLEVDFFGGEPLLNFEVVKQLVAYGREIEREKEKHFRFTPPARPLRSQY